MSIKTVRWSKITNFTGRNGMMKCSGVELLPSSTGEVIITALTSKGAIGRCDIWVPAEALKDLIEALQAVQAEVTDY